jgi:hypothetical protein
MYSRRHHAPAAENTAYRTKGPRTKRILGGRYPHTNDKELAFGQLPEITDEQTLHGLQYQWFAVLHSRVLVALSRQ